MSRPVHYEHAIGMQSFHIWFSTFYIKYCSELWIFMSKIFARRVRKLIFTSGSGGLAPASPLPLGRRWAGGQVDFDRSLRGWGVTPVWMIFTVVGFRSSFAKFIIPTSRLELILAPKHNITTDTYTYSRATNNGWLLCCPGPLDVWPRPGSGPRRELWRVRPHHVTNELSLM